MPTSDRETGTPSKPAGILLTPGTGTTRRKRVSFGYDIPGQKDSTAQLAAGNKRQRNANANAKTNEDKTKKPTEARDAEEDEWEEDDDGDHVVNDMTLDLNEPHSQSGKYWKEEFEKYHEDARLELEKLLKYKQLAKSYAKQRDAETLQLAERLRDEQLKVLKMEKMIAENTSNIASAREAEDGDATVELLDKLSSQTALATQYREQVQQLETELEEALHDREERGESQRRRRQASASPATHKALAETQRELRQTKSQLREMGALRDQVASLKAKLQTARQETKPSNDAPSETTRSKELRAQIRQLKEESLRKDEEMFVLRAEFESYRKESENHDADTRAVLASAQSKIAELKNEVKTLKTLQAEKPRPQSWHVPQDDSIHTGLDGFNDPVIAKTRRSLETDERRRPQLAPKEHKSRSLRDKFREDAPSDPEPAPVQQDKADEVRKWQKFVPRSPRNLDFLGEDMVRRIENGGITPAATKKKNPTSRADRAEKKRRSSKTDSEDGIDLLRDRFAKLGGPEEGGQGHSGINIPGRINLPPERRAAALARIEKRMAEKKRARARNLDKENIQPMR